MLTPERRKRPVVTAKAGTKYLSRHVPQATVVTIDHANGTCGLELVDNGGSLMVRLFNPKGEVTLCAPLPNAPHGQCIWSTRYSLNETKEPTP